MTAFHAFAGLVLAAILARQWWKLHRLAQERTAAAHVRRAQIRQRMDQHPHERGDVPAEKPPADPVTAQRIAMGLSRGLWTRRVVR